jgi:hypothetical protein
MRHHPTDGTVPRDLRRRPRRRLAGLVLAFSALAVSLVAPAAASAATPTTAATDGSSATPCTGGRWPARVQGAPSVHAGSAAGDYLWHDATGWHLRVTHVGTSTVGFSGTIRANKPLHVRGYKLETEDKFTVSADGLSVSYRFVNHGGLDGLDFTTECATRLGVTARMNGALLPARRIWVGRYGHHPLGNPFAILRPA